MKIPKPQNIAKCLSFLFFCFLEKDNSNIMSFHSWIKSGSTEHLSWLPPLLRARKQSQAKRLRLFILVLCPGQEISNVRHFSTIILQPSEPPPAKGALHPAVATVGGPHQWAFSATEKRAWLCQRAVKGKTWSIQFRGDLMKAGSGAGKKHPFSGVSKI